MCFFCSVKLFLSIILFSCSTFALTQMLHDANEQLENGMPYFSKMFIRFNGIKTISGTYATKADNEMMRESAEFVYYKFNQSGELIFEYKTFLGDTLFILYVYDELGNLIIKRSSDRYGFQSNHYRYDDKQRITYHELRSCSNVGQDRMTFYPDESKKITSEKYEYVDLDVNAYKKIYLNNNGEPYKESYFYNDSKGKLLEQMSYQKSGYGKSSVKNEYDEMGRLIKKHLESISYAIGEKEYIYEYDSSGNIYAIKYYENEEFKTDFQYVYDEKNKFLKALIMQDVSSHVMTIIKYNEYVFY